LYRCNIGKLYLQNNNYQNYLIMTDSNRDYLSNNNTNAMQLPNATAALVLGILSIVVCFICGIIALVISNKDMALYRANPELYTTSSYNNIKACRICAIIGIALQALGIIVYIIFISFFISMAGSGALR
jgi:presenilin-like A22 family membrane protease